MRKIKLIISILSLGFIVSCEKVIDLELKSAESKLVIEGNITNQAGPYFVKLTRTVPFDQTNTYPEVADAVVIVSDNSGIVDTLTYTSLGIYKTNKIIGTVGRTYYLKVITSDSKEYTSQSMMPELVHYDSLTVTKLNFGSQTNNVVTPYYVDPMNQGNNYNFVVKQNGKLIKDYISWDDNTNNGKIINRPIIANNLEFISGDTISVEMQCIDRTAYNYYFTLALMGDNGPGGSTIPANPANGITGGALGLFSAHCTDKKIVTVP